MNMKRVHTPTHRAMPMIEALIAARLDLARRNLWTTVWSVPYFCRA